MSAEFEIPFDVLPLPSKGLLYPGKEDTVKVQYLTASDENVLTSQNLIKSGKVLDVLLSRKVKDLNMPVGNLLVGDRNAIMIWLRATGYGEKYNVMLTDPNTYEEFEYEVDLNSLKTKPLEVEPDERGLFTFMLPRSKKEVKFKLLTVSDETNILRKSEQRSKKIKSKISTTLTDRLMTQIVSIDGVEDKTQLSRMVEFMPAFDSLKFREYSDSIEPGVDMTVEVEGPSGETFQAGVPIAVDFFWPNAGV